MATVLVVDDDAKSRAYLAAIVQSMGHRPVQAGDGREALLKARVLVPDLIVTDISMPVMDGFEFLRAVREEPAPAATPALVYTGLPDVDCARRALVCGVYLVLAKPGRPKALMSAIRCALEPLS